MQPGRERGEFLRESRADRGSTVLGKRGEALLDEFVERHGVGNRRRDQVVLEENLALALFAERDRSDRRNPDRVKKTRSTTFVASLAAAKPLPKLGAKIGNQEMLDVNRALSEINAIDNSVGAFLDDVQDAAAGPFIEPQAVAVEEGVSPLGPNPPANVAVLRPMPIGGLKDPVAMILLEPSTDHPCTSI